MSWVPTFAKTGQAFFELRFDGVSQNGDHGKSVRNRRKRTWSQNDFELDPLGVVRLTFDLAREIAITALKTTPVHEAAKSVKRVIE